MLKHVSDDDTHCTILQMLWDGRFEDSIPYRPFSEWQDVEDASFKHLIRGLTNLDPTSRLTAHQALDHPWFADSEIG